jgi:hypothetical protein
MPGTLELSTTNRATSINAVFTAFDQHMMNLTQAVPADVSELKPQETIKRIGYLSPSPLCLSGHLHHSLLRLSIGVIELGLPNGPGVQPPRALRSQVAACH